MLTRCSTVFFRFFIFQTFVFRVLEKKKKNPKQSFWLGRKALY